MARFGSKLIQAIKDKGNKLEGEMSFFEHLEALRWHLIRASLAVVAFAIAAYAYYDEIFKYVIMAPTRTDFWAYRMMCDMGELFQRLIPAWFSAKDFCVDSIHVTLINTEMAGQFTLKINSSLMIGLVLGIPYFFWELWRFIKPALHEKERKAASGFVMYASLLFLLGVMFGYFIITPLSIRFLAGFIVSPDIKNYFDVDSYLSSVSTLTLATGVVFQLPILVYIVASLGFLTPKLMRSSRRYAIVIILIIAAIVTPTPDALTMTVVAVPLFILFELSIVVAGIVEKRRMAKELAA
ncbi:MULTISPECIES: twin-arginine translocase subunit TatC [Mucilaginibacter]|uniref:twin-arginine translocase subunit TatC n=1 Tax=Mucilaginibacter TaxID=423349 RepID=UPI002092563A|nr:MULTISPECIES: twin-arginine translocase subunit TatC [Mucilaginibacter]MCO5949755.1 twin-arginine translocase subunit TatC [Mucilaginibacter flavidus]